MCGRFTLTADGATIQQALGLQVAPLQASPRYNIAPSQAVGVVTNTQPGQLSRYQWGLVPHWAKDRGIGSPLINARSETAHEKPSFRDALRYRRCLVPADGWYEWQPAPNQTHKRPVFIHRADFGVFAFAGLWDRWQAPDGEAWHTFTILTTDATETLRPLHHRMPVILRRDDYETWLHGDDMAQRRGLLRPFDGDPFEYYAVSRRVNKPAHDSPENIVPVADEGGARQLPLF